MRILSLSLAALGLCFLVCWLGVGWIAGDVGTPPAEVGAGPQGRSRELARARRACRLEAIDDFIAGQLMLIEHEPDDGARWRVLAEAYLERALFPDLLLGLRTGEPLRTELDAELERDVARGLDALERALELGDETSETHRIRMALVSRRLTGLASALSLEGEITAALERALELDQADPRVQVAIGCRLLFAPRLLGHDARAALEHLLPAAEGLPLDERPLIYAALARHALGEAGEALGLMRRAARRTPANAYAREVARRLEAGEDDPFGRDVRP